MLAEIERKLGLAERLARCIEAPRAPRRVEHGLAEMIRFRALLIAAGGACPRAGAAGPVGGCQRLRCPARRSGVQDRGWPVAGERS
jgi:hypothetical protein